LQNSGSDRGALAIIIMIVTGLPTFYTLFVLWPPAVNWGERHHWTLLIYLARLAGNDVFATQMAEIAPVWPAFLWRAHTLYGVIAVAFLFTLLSGKSRKAASLLDGKHIRGRQRINGRDAIRAIKRVLRDERDLTPKTRDYAIEILPGLRGSLSREVRAEIVVGQIGSGKTQIINQRLREIIRRGDRALIHDFKGDFTSWLPGGFVLLNPADARSGVWDIARDVRTPEEALNFASAMIEASSDPMWSNAARMLFCGWIVMLQKTKPGAWTWADLARVTAAEFAELKKVTLEHYPQARRMIEEESVTTQGILINQSAFLNILHTLAKAWGDADRSRYFSMRGWLLNEQHPSRIVVFQNAPHMSQMAGAWISSILRYSADICRSPLVGETNIREPRHRRLWFVLDEFAMLGGDQSKSSMRMNMIADLNALSRSKGVRICVGCQDWSQVVASIGRERADSWQSMVGSLWILRNNGPAAKTLAEVIGQRETERTRQNVSVNARGTGTSDSILIETRPVFLPSELQSDLGDFLKFPVWARWMPGWMRRRLRIDGEPWLRGVPLGFGDTAPVVEWPVVKTRELRPPLIAANWCDVQFDDEKQESDHV
jgi:hypothetical protein